MHDQFSTDHKNVAILITKHKDKTNHSLPFARFPVLHIDRLYALTWSCDWFVATFEFAVIDRMREFGFQDAANLVHVYIIRWHILIAS